MRAGFMVRAGVAAATLAGGVALVPGVASAQGAVSVTAPVDISVPGPVGGSQTCVSPGAGCVNVQGVSDLKVKATVSADGLVAPVVTPASAPGCTGSVNVGAKIIPARAGTATVSVAVSYQPVNASGAPSGSPVTVTRTVSLTPGGPPVTVTECASAS